MKISSLDDVGSVIREMRLHHGLTQADLASHIKVSRRWVSELESGQPGAEFETVLAVLKFFGVSIVVQDDQALYEAPRLLIRKSSHA